MSSQLTTASVPSPPRKISAMWSPLVIVLAPIIFPPILIAYVGLFAASEPIVKLGFLIMALGAWFGFDRQFRGKLNENLIRVSSALRARESAAKGDERVALLLRSFAQQDGYRDVAAAFSIFELVEPALRASGFRPCALGRCLPLPAEHGVALIDSPDSAWWDHFQVMSAMAAVIVITPETTPSLRRELRSLKARSLLYKTVLIMPPKSLHVLHYTTADGGAHTGPAGNDAARAERWRALQCEWAESIGGELPDYDGRGALLELDPAGAVRANHVLREHGEQARWSLRAVFDDDSGYRRRYGVEFGRLWQRVCRGRHFNGPPVRIMINALQPEPIVVGKDAYWNPPGANGSPWDVVVTTACLGWGAVLGALIPFAFD